MFHKKAKTFLRWCIAAFFISVGVHHFIDPAPYLAIVPPYLTQPLLLVHISGLFEVLGGAGLCLATTRKVAAWGLIALLVAVYPANIHMLVNEVYLPDMPREKWLLWIRMPLQFVLAAAVLWTGEVWRHGRSSDQIEEFKH